MKLPPQTTWDVTSEWRDKNDQSSLTYQGETISLGKYSPRLGHSPLLKEAHRITFIVNQKTPDKMQVSLQLLPQGISDLSKALTKSGIEHISNHYFVELALSRNQANTILPILLETLVDERIIPPSTASDIANNCRDMSWECSYHRVEYR